MSLELHAFLSPVYYNLVLGIAYLGKRLGFLRPIDPLYHNYNMTFQSCILLSLAIYDYVQVARVNNLQLTDFINISNLTGTTHQTQLYPIVLYCYLGSKLFEWIDTVLLIINNKKIIGLHWWHHMTIGVAFYTGYFTSSVLWIGTLNSFIHIIMYLYYADAPGIRPIAKYLTQLQIVQLFGGVYLNYVSYFYNTEPKYKLFSLINGLICLSYGLMFLQFYGQKYKKIDKKIEKMPVNKKIIIGDYEYDITNFKHPGGTVINFMTNGQNATEAFNEFHFRSKKARAVLDSLPKRRLDAPHPEDRDVLDDFTRFRQSLVDRGFFKPSYIHIAYRIIELCSIFAFATYMIPKSILISTMAFGLFGGRCGWIQHEGGHNSLTGNMRTDKLIQEFFIGFGLYNSGNMWNMMHNKHHATPQKINHDIDLDTTPLVAFFDTAIESNRRSAYSKWWLRFQAYTFLPITSGIFVPLFWMLYLHPRQIVRDKNWRQGFWIIMGHFTRTYLFMTVGGFVWHKALLYHMISSWWDHMYLFGHFSLSHTTTDVIENDEDPSWVRYAIEHSVDISPQNPAVSWIMGYLNCQVIHHLFPSMPQFRGPEVSLELIQFCEKWDIKYTILGYREAWYQMFDNLNTVGKTYNGEKSKKE
jgi:fatty acid desaturase 2 (delta-6 desaturase)